MPDQPTHQHYGDDAIVNAETKHEESDVNVRALLWFVVIFIVFAIVTHAALWLLYRFYVQIGRGDAANSALSSVAQPVDANVPATPRLQPFPSKDTVGKPIPPYTNTPVTDLADMRAHEDQVLNHYGWVDRQHGVVHIPIERAKQLALQSNAFTVNPGAAAPVAASPAPAATTPSNPGSTPTGTLQ